MPRLFSYVVDHDLGYAPNPFGDFCSLAKCKYGTVKGKNGSIRRNIVELAEEDDWIAGTGGASSQSAGHGKLIFAMCVDEIISLADYCRGNIGSRIDAEHDIVERGRLVGLTRKTVYKAIRQQEVVGKKTSTRRKSDRKWAFGPGGVAKLRTRKLGCKNLEGKVVRPVLHEGFARASFLRASGMGKENL